MAERETLFASPALPSGNCFPLLTERLCLFGPCEGTNEFLALGKFFCKPDLQVAALP